MLCHCSVQSRSVQVQLLVKLRSTLASFVSVKSDMMFNLIGIEDLTWLGAPVALWPCFPSYVRANSFVKDLLVVNDGAERGMCN